MTNQDNFSVAEVGLAKRLGVSRELLKSIRDREMVRGHDWEQVGKSLLYTEKAALACASLVGVPLSLSEKTAGVDSLLTGDEPSCEAESNSATAEEVLGPVLAPPVERELTVIKTTANPRILMAADGEKTVRVLVYERRLPQEQSKFIHGMAIPCRQVEGDLWELTRSYPRWRGRW